MTSSGLPERGVEQRVNVPLLTGKALEADKAMDEGKADALPGTERGAPDQVQHFPGDLSPAVPVQGGARQREPHGDLPSSDNGFVLSSSEVVEEGGQEEVVERRRKGCTSIEQEKKRLRQL